MCVEPSPVAGYQYHLGAQLLSNQTLVKQGVLVELLYRRLALSNC